MRLLLFLSLLVAVEAKDYVGAQQLFAQDGFMSVPRGVYRLRVLVVGGGESGERCKRGVCHGGAAGRASVRVIAVTGPRSIRVSVGKGARNSDQEAQSSSFGDFVTAMGGSRLLGLKPELSLDEKFFPVFRRSVVQREERNTNGSEDGAPGVSISTFALPCAGNASSPYKSDVRGIGGCGYGAGGGSVTSSNYLADGGVGGDGVVYVEMANRVCPSRTDLAFAIVNPEDTARSLYRQQLQFVSSVSQSYVTALSEAHLGLFTNERQPIKYVIQAMKKTFPIDIPSTGFRDDQILPQTMSVLTQFATHGKTHMDDSFSKVLVIIANSSALVLTKGVMHFCSLIRAQGVRIIVVSIGPINTAVQSNVIQNPYDAMTTPSIAQLSNLSELVADIACTGSRKNSQKSWSDKSLEELRQELMKFLDQTFEDLDLNNKTFLQDVVDIGRHLMLENTRLKNITKGSPALQIVDVYFRFGFAIASKLEKYLIDQTQSLSLASYDKSFVMTSTSLDPNLYHGNSFPQKQENASSEETVFFHPSIFSSRKGASQIVSMVYDSMDDVHPTDNETSLLTHRIIASSVLPPLRTPFKTPVVLKFKNSMNIEGDSRSRSCVFWAPNNNDYPPFGQWQEAGCRVSPQSNLTHTVCLCDHLTNFAVLMQVKDVKISKYHEKALTIITYTGCAISAVGCALTIIIFLILQSLRSERIIIHLNLAAALLLAQIAFALGSVATINKDACLSVAIVLYYLFMSVFTWMLVEGIHIYVMVIKVFEAERKRKGIYFAIGWGVPAVFTIATAAGYRENLVAEDFCWLSIKSGAIWTFVGPALFIVLINFIVLVMVLRVTANAYGNASLFKDIKAVFKAFLTLVPLLGTTWVLGVLAINYETLVFQYLFCILGTLQGLFVFLLYCVGSSEVRRELKRKWQNWDTQRQISMSSQQNKKFQVDMPGRRKDTNTNNTQAMERTGFLQSTAVVYKSKSTSSSNQNALYNV